jgi:epoxyqueuosine reductase
MEREDLVLELAQDSGFDLAGLAPLRRPRAGHHFETWLAAGHHGEMDYLERNRGRILEPQGLLPTGRTILSLGLAHSRPGVHLADGSRVARYAAGADYHNLLRRRLRKLARRLRGEGLIHDFRQVVDAGPLMERSHAAEAGLGFESKAANLLHPVFGPWFFLGELILDADLVPTEAPAPPSASCGSCTACLDACPTGALRSPGVVDARACISYQTIENPGPIPHELRAAHGDWAFGCDICSEVCPWGQSAPDLGERFGLHPALAEDQGVLSWIEAPDGDLGAFAEHWNGSPMQRPRREGLARNAAIVLGNRPSESGRRALLRALSFDPSAMVRGSAAWALGQGHGEDSGTRPALESARSDGDPTVVLEAEAALEAGARP